MPKSEEEVEMGYLVVGGIVLVISGIVASKFDEIADMKGHSGYFWWCFILGAIGWAMVIALPDRRLEIKAPIHGDTSNQKPTTIVEVNTDDALPPL